MYPLTMRVLQKGQIIPESSGFIIGDAFPKFKCVSPRKARACLESLNSRGVTGDLLSVSAGVLKNSLNTKLCANGFFGWVKEVLV
jgi:hypothetical protein